MTFGVVPTGFARKRLDDLVPEFEDATRTVFGDAVLLDPETPMGQLLGLFALLSAQLWELAEDTYQSVDPDQAEGPRLDQLGKIRGVARPIGETDAIFRRRLTNAARTDIHLRPLVNAVEAIAGVEYVRVWENASDAADEHGIASHSLAVAVLGGLDALIAQAIYQETVAGIGLHGDTFVAIEQEGFCRSIGFVPLTAVDLTLEIDVRPLSPQGCATPDLPTITAKLESDLGFDAEFGFVNGEDVTVQRIVGVVSQLSGVEVVAVRLSRDPELPPSAETVSIAFNEIARVGTLSVGYP